MFLDMLIQKKLKKKYKNHLSGTNMWVTWVTLGHTKDMIELNHVVKFNDDRMKNEGDANTRLNM